MSAIINIVSTKRRELGNKGENITTTVDEMETKQNKTKLNKTIKCNNCACRIQSRKEGLALKGSKGLSSIPINTATGVKCGSFVALCGQVQ